MPVSLAEMVAHLRRRQQQQAQQAQARAQRLHALAPAARDLLRRQHGVDRVWLFGSLARGDSGPDSDVDLAVEGLQPADYFQVLGELMGLFGGRVDLVRMEDASPSLRQRVLEEGHEL